MSLVLGIGGLLTSPFLIGGIIGIVAIVLGIVAIVLSRRANARVKAAGREPRTGGALGLGVIGIITGIVAVIIPVVLLQTAERVMGACEHLEPGTPEYQRCIADQFENKQDGGPAGGAGDGGAGGAGEPHPPGRGGHMGVLIGWLTTNDAPHGGGQEPMRVLN